MKLQKLLYLAHGLNLALYGERLIDTNVQAWKYDPVIAPLYYELRHYGASPINIPIELRSSELFLPDSEEEESRTLAPKTRQLLNQVWKAYGGLSAVQLSSLTHAKNLPEGELWYKTWHNGGSEVWGAEIPDDLIRESFKKLVVKE